jgi:hypothetical protein
VFRFIAGCAQLGALVYLYFHRPSGPLIAVWIFVTLARWREDKNGWDIAWLAFHTGQLRDDISSLSNRS